MYKIKKKKVVLRFLRCCVLECCEAFTIFSDFELSPNALPDVTKRFTEFDGTNCNKKPQHKTAAPCSSQVCLTIVARYATEWQL